MSAKEIPIGLIMSIAQNENAFKYYANLDDFTKNKINSYVQSSVTGDDAKKRIETVISNLEKSNLNFLN
ncbi:MAG: hypothetical protein N2749_07065 [Clostridia bacterium]|nr:hypothetical protein [Clostridia bacterium]